MAKFSTKSTAHNQAKNVVKQLQNKHLKSVGTVRNYQSALKQAAQYAGKQLNTSLKSLTVSQATSYLQYRAGIVSQSTLNMDRLAIQSMLHHVTNQLPLNQKLPMVHSAQLTQKGSRTYTPSQIKSISSCQSHSNSLATQIAYAAGLRAHELHTLRRLTMTSRQPSTRPALPQKFSHRSGVRYTVQGKGGLVREICIPKDLANKLEALRTSTPITIVDRNINYQSHYKIGGGQSWSNSFSSASQRALGWSNGAHGLRHSYAQERVKELLKDNLYELAKEIVSQEMGHFRPDITDCYLR